MTRALDRPIAASSLAAVGTAVAYPRAPGMMTLNRERPGTLFDVIISPKRVIRVLSLIAVGLVLASVAGQIAKFGFGYDRLVGFVPAFNLDSESNIPAWYSTSLLLIGAALFGIAAQAAWNIRDRFAWHWSGLALLFAGFSVDELAGIHEQTIHPLRTLLRASGIFYYAWVIGGIGVVLLVGAASLAFLRALDTLTRRRRLVAGAIYVGGALGLEMIGAAYASRFGVQTPAYAVLTTLEESMEIAGLITLIHALLHYLAAHQVKVRFIHR